MIAEEKLITALSEVFSDGLSYLHFIVHILITAHSHQACLTKTPFGCQIDARAEQSIGHL